MSGDQLFGTITMAAIAALWTFVPYADFFGDITALISQMALSKFLEVKDLLHSKTVHQGVRDSLISSHTVTRSLLVVRD